MSRLDANPVPKRDARAIARETILMIPNIVKLLARITRDPRVSVKRKTFAAAALIYVVSPIDLIPDFIAGIGQLDDLIVVAIALNHLIEGAGREIIEEHWDGSADSLDLVLAATEWGAEIVPGPLRKLLPG
ncbi:MAG: YkvA family protein [Actinomycetota bacterium]|nr:YkvA family protein [Actinomycetota bacterium]